MPKVTTSYDISDLEDRKELDLALAAKDMYCALTTLAEDFRQIEKYDKDKMTRDRFIEILDTYDINLNRFN